MVNILDQYEPMYFQIDTFTIFQGSKLTILVLLERGDSVLLQKELLCPTTDLKKFRDARGLVAFPLTITRQFLFGYLDFNLVVEDFLVIIISSMY